MCLSDSSLVSKLCPTCETMDGSLLGSSAHGFSRQEYWSGFPFSSQRDLLNPASEPRSPALQVFSCTAGGSLQADPPGKPCVCLDTCMSQNVSLPLDTVAFTLIYKTALFN